MLPMSPPIPLTLPMSVHPETSAAFVVTFTSAAPGRSETMQPALMAAIPATSIVRTTKFTGTGRGSWGVPSAALFQAAG
jgi:hypothetical protein